VEKHGILAKNTANTVFWKITAFDENHGFSDFRVSVIFYCPYISVLTLSVMIWGENAVTSTCHIVILM